MSASARGSQRRARRFAVGTATLVLAAGSAVLFAAAPPAGAAQAGKTSSAPTMVVLDASGSMLASDAPGSRIAAAKRAVDGLVGSVPSDAHLGLEVYGTSTSSAGSAKAAGCRDIKTLVPVGPVDKESFRGKVDGVTARGYTPIGAALRQAAAGLPREGKRSIVLVSDGEDTCAPPGPCDVARQLHEQGVDLAIHTVGFKVGAKARAQLECIAAASGGTYVDAPDGPTLSTKLRVQVDRALRGYEARGTPISGGHNTGDGPLLRPGQYVDTFDRGGASVADNGTAKYYRVDLRRGETPYFSATVIPPARRASGTTLQIQATISPYGDSSGCSEDGNGYDVSIINGKVSASTAVVLPGEVGGRSCLRPGPAVIKVQRAGNAFADEPLKVELAWRVEPPADATGLPAAVPAAEKNVRASSSAPAVDLESGSSFNDAPEVRPGVYRDSFVSGETRYVKVHVDWGQRLAYSFAPTRLSGLGVTSGVAGYTSVVNPVRQKLDPAIGSSSSGAFLGSTESPMYGSTVAPVRYRNRVSKDDDISALSVAGDYYVVLSSAFPASGAAQLTVPYSLTISVVGRAERGPRYLATPGTGSSGSTGSGSTGPSTGSSGSTTSGQRRDDGGVPTAAVVSGTAGGVLLCGAGAAVFLLRRRRATTAGQADTGVLPSDPWHRP